MNSQFTCALFVAARKMWLKRNSNALQDKLPILQNFGAFLLAAAFVRQSPLFKSSAVDKSLISKEGQKEQDAKDMGSD